MVFCIEMSSFERLTTTSASLASPPKGPRDLGSVCLAAGALVGCVVALATLDPRFILGTGGKWLHPQGDFNAYLVAWNYFVADIWRFPVFSLPMMSYPEGGNVLFNDALPLMALPSKVLFGLTGAKVNPFGWWMLLTYVLQGMMAVRVVRSVGARSVPAAVGAAALAVSATFFVSRIGHIALSGHFLILWGLALYFENVRSQPTRLWEMWLLAVLTLLVNSYLFAMVMVLHVVTIATLWRRRGLTRREVATTVVGAATVLGVALAAGYGTFLRDPSKMRAGGFGLYSWNLVGLLVPPQLPTARDGTGGQYEGEAYIGKGALLLLLTCLVWRPREIAEHVRAHAVLCGALVLLAVYAASNQVYFGKTRVLFYFLPERAIDMANYFRATGRFIWPLAYTLILMPAALAFRWWRPAGAIAVVAIAALLQVHDALPTIRSVYVATGTPNLDLIDDGRIKAWMQEHERLWNFPSIWCGGLGPPTKVFGDVDSDRELQLQLLGAELGLPTNSVYSSRCLKDCGREAAWAANPTLEPGVLYFLNPTRLSASPALAALVATDRCLTLPWATVCSQRFAEPRAH
jgi:hypothetical protein